MGQKKTKRQYRAEAQDLRLEIERRGERLSVVERVLAEYGFESTIGPGHAVRKMGDRLVVAEKKVERLEEDNGHLSRQGDTAREELGNTRRELRALEKSHVTLNRVVEILADKFPR